MSRSATAVAAARPPPPPDLSLSVEQLSRAAGVPVRTLRYYVKRGALVPPEFRSRNTRYDCTFLIRLRAIAALRRQGLKLRAIVPRLDAASPDDLLRLAGYAVPDTAGSPAPPGGAARPLAAGFLGPYRGAGPSAERWEHLEVCPGVKLLVRCEADAEAWRVAREILATFGMRG
jgi:DNA-binding transcriptional MerR regulator